MNILLVLVKRNSKLFFKDKGMLFTSLITPLILLVLYVTFLGNVYRDAFVSAIPQGLAISDKLINAAVGGQLSSSLLAVCCVTVSFCSNMLMVQDKVTGALRDFSVSTVRKPIIALGYYISTAITTLAICLIAAVACFVYIACIGWYLTVTDVLLILLDVFLLVMFGTALSSIVSFFLSSQGQISAVGTVVSAGYGFICGAYMPISQFSSGLQKALSFLPGTYGTVLLRKHALGSVFQEMNEAGLPEEVVGGLQNAVDYNLRFFGNEVPVWMMFLVLVSAIVFLIAVYVFMNRLRNR